MRYTLTLGFWLFLEFRPVTTGCGGGAPAIWFVVFGWFVWFLLLVGCGVVLCMVFQLLWVCFEYGFDVVGLRLLV